MLPAPSIPSSLPLSKQVTLSTVDLDELETFIDTGGLLEKRALTRLDSNGKINAHISSLQLGRLQFLGVHLGANLLATSVPLKAAQLVIPVSGRLLNEESNKQEFLAKTGSAFFHATNSPARVRWEHNSSALVIRIPEHFLQSIYQSIADEEMPSGFRLRPNMDLTRGDGQSLLGIIQNILKEFESGNNFSNDHKLITLWEELLITTLLSSQVPAHKSIEQIRNTQPIYHYVKRTTDYIMDHIDEPITMSELVRESGVAMRTLHDGFRKSLGIGPMSFIRKRKLDRVYAELVNSSPQGTKVADVAAKWGFYHASHFTRQYKKQFSELPSETLSKKDLSIYVP